MDNILPRKEIIGIDLTYCLFGKVKAKDKEIWSALAMSDFAEKLKEFIEQNKHGIKTLYKEVKISQVHTLTSMLNQAGEQWEKSPQLQKVTTKQGFVSIIREKWEAQYGSVTRI